MTQPRRIIPGMTVMVTRRTLLRTHLLRPDEQLTQFYLYCLALMANRYDIAVHAAVLMSTHEHLVVTDRMGKLPLFLRELHRMVALGVKTLRGWDGPVWDQQKTSVVHLVTPQAVIEKIAYVLANPASAGLVRRAHQWPGVVTRPDEMGLARLMARRPTFFLDPENPLWPECVCLPIEMPQLSMSAEGIREGIVAELKRLEQHAQSAAAASGCRVPKKPRIEHLSPYSRATSREPIRDRNPQLAAGRNQHNVLEAARAALRSFRSAYREALIEWRAGARRVVFPPETWLMKVLHDVCVAPASAELLRIATNL